MTTSGRESLPVIAENIPASLRALSRWICWKYDGEGKKPPIDPKTGRKFAYTDPKNHLAFDEALAGYNKRCGQRGGLGFVLPAGIVAIDLDNCVDDDDHLAPWAAVIVDRFRQTYTEISPSGHGIRILLLGQRLAGVKDDRGHIEVFGKDRFVTVTGRTWPGSASELSKCQGNLDWLCQHHLQGPIELPTTLTDTPTHTPTTASIGSAGSVGSTGSITVEEVIQKTLPTRQQQREGLTLSLARGLKFDCGLEGKTIGDLVPIVKQWWKRAQPVIGTQPFSATLADFNRSWKRARIPLFGAGLQTVLEAARANPVPGADEFDEPEAQLLLAICRQLAGPSGVFYLSAVAAGRLLSMHPMQVYRLLELFVDLGWLEVVRKGKQGLGQPATRYRWIGRPNEANVRR